MEDNRNITIFETDQATLVERCRKFAVYFSSTPLDNTELGKHKKSNIKQKSPQPSTPPAQEPTSNAQSEGDSFLANGLVKNLLLSLAATLCVMAITLASRQSWILAPVYIALGVFVAGLNKDPKKILNGIATGITLFVLQSVLVAILNWLLEGFLLLLACFTLQLMIVFLIINRINWVRSHGG